MFCYAQAMPRPEHVSFGDHLITWRRDRNLKQGDLAKLLNVSPMTVNRWESGFLPRDLDEIEQRLRDLQEQKGEPEFPTRDHVRLLWS